MYISIYKRYIWNGRTGGASIPLLQRSCKTIVKTVYSWSLILTGFSNTSFLTVPCILNLLSGGRRRKHYYFFTFRIVKPVQ